LLIYSQKSGNASDTDTQLRWSGSGIAGEPVRPSPAAMRTDSTRWARRRQNLLLSLNQGKDLNVLPTPMGRPDAAKRSPCHIHPPHRSNNDGFSLHRGRRRQEGSVAKKFKLIKMKSVIMAK